MYANMNTTPTFSVWERCVSRKNLIRKAVTTMSITNATTQESLVQYPSPYKVINGNLCMEVTEKHSTYDRKLSNFTPYIKSELTVDDGATEKNICDWQVSTQMEKRCQKSKCREKTSLPSIGCLKSGVRNASWRSARTSGNTCAMPFNRQLSTPSNSLSISRQAGRGSMASGIFFCPATANSMSA